VVKCICVTIKTTFEYTDDCFSDKLTRNEAYLVPRGSRVTWKPRCANMTLEQGQVIVVTGECCHRWMLSQVSLVTRHCCHRLPI